MIDLHSHSNKSDGTDSPEDLVRKAHGAGLKALALTDHDTLKGLDEAEETAQALGMDFVRGCEISSKTEYGSMHILGLWIPKACDNLQYFLDNAVKVRDERNLLMLEKLRKLGINIELDELRNRFHGSIGRPHMAKLLFEKAYVHSTAEAFTKYIGKGGKAYVPKKSVSPHEAVRALADAGAMVFIAHPLLENTMPRDWLSQKIADLKKDGVCGLEAWHGAQTEKECAIVEDLATKHDLLISGGSDYHGLAKYGFNLGYAQGNRPIPDEIYNNLLEYRKNKGYAVQ